MKVRLLIETAGIVLCVILSLTLGYLMGPPGLALSFSLQFLFLMMAGLCYLHRGKIIQKTFRIDVFRSVKKISASALVMFIALLACSYLYGDSAGAGFRDQLRQLGVSAGIGLGVYFLISHLLNVREARDLIVIFRKKLPF